MTAASLSIRDVRWRAGGKEILTGVDLDVKAGELVILMGRNGAGKSTLLDIAAGLRRATAGQVSLEGRALDEWTPRDRARHLTHLPQAVRPDLPFVAGELVLMGRYPHTDRWFESDADRQAVETAMRRTGCWDLRHRTAWTLSGGERQRVLLAACLAQAPRVFLLDEPSTHLDVDQQLHCFDLLGEQAAGGAACLTVTHDLNLALTYGTRIVVLDGGRVAVDLPAAEARRRSDWLALFSARLTLAQTAGGRTWVAYS